MLFFSRTRLSRTLPIVACALLVSSIALAAPKDKAPKAAAESDYYKILTYNIPAGVVLESGALEWLPEGKLAVSTRRGEIWLIDNALSDDPEKATFKLFASGLH